MTGIINGGYSATMQAPAVNAVATGYNATNQAPAVHANVTDRVVDPSTQTVAGQVQGIINQNSPLLQSARARSQQAMNDRGLGNSSIAIRAGEDALYSAALPIATADANVYGNAANLNTTSHNTAGLADAAASNRVNEVNAGATNTASQFGASAQNQVSAINAGAANTVNAGNAQASNVASANNLTADTQRTISDSSLASSERNAALNSRTQIAMNEASITSAEKNAQLSASTQQSIATLQSDTQKIMNDANLTQADKNAKLAALTQTNIAHAADLISFANTRMTLDSQQAIVAANNASAQLLASISTTSQQKIAQLDNDNKLLIQTDASAATLHANAMQSIASIEGSANISDKAGAINQILTSLNNGLAVIGVIGHDLDHVTEQPGPEVGTPNYRDGQNGFDNALR